MREYKRNCPKCDKVLSYSNGEHRRSANKKNSICQECKGINASIIQREKWKDLKYRKKMTDCQLRVSVRLGKREKMVRKVMENRKPAYNPVACKFIDLLNGAYGWKLKHAMAGAEENIAGYYVDGYDKERGIIFEYDEPYHYYANGELKDKDKKRQDDLVEYFRLKGVSPLFIRYDEKRNRMVII